jgi:hypothetical protein
MMSKHQDMIEAIIDTTDIEALREALLYVVEHSHEVSTEDTTGYSVNDDFEAGRKNMAQYIQESVSHYVL